MPDGQEGMNQQQGQMQEGTDAGASIAGLMEATQFLRDRIVEAPGVPDEMKQAITDATNQYNGVLSQIAGGGAPQQEPEGAVPMETVQGGQPISPAGV